MNRRPPRPRRRTHLRHALLAVTVVLAATAAGATAAHAQSYWWGGGGGYSCDDADGDGICNGMDECPYDERNDADGDGKCAGDDPCPRNRYDRCHESGRGLADCGKYDDVPQDPDEDGVRNPNDDDDDCDQIADTLEIELWYLDRTDKDTDGDGLEDFEDLHPGNAEDEYDLTLEAAKFQEYVKSDCCTENPGDPYLDGAALGFDGEAGSHPYGVSFDNLRSDDHKHDHQAEDCDVGGSYCKEYRYEAKTVLPDLLPQDPRSYRYDRWRDGSPEVSITLPMMDHDHGPDGDDEYYGSTYDRLRILRKISDGVWYEDAVLYDQDGTHNGRFLWDWKSALRSCGIAIYDRAERQYDDYVTASEVPGDPEDDGRCVR